MMWWFVLFLLLSGCTSFYQTAVEKAASNYKTKTIQSFNDFILDTGDLETLTASLNQTRNTSVLYAFVCNNSKIPAWKRYWYYIISGFNRRYLFDPPLLGGVCWVQDVGKLPSLRAVYLMANLSDSEIRDNSLFWDDNDTLLPFLRDNPKWYERIYTFGLASGPTFADFNNLNPYCNSSLRYSIKFIKGTKERYIIPITPDRRAACYLDLSVIPTYVFHGDNGFPRMDNAWELAQTLYKREPFQYYGKGIGPVVLITESSLNKTTFFDYTYYPDGTRSSLKNVELAFAQAENLKNECPACLVGLYIPLGINVSNYEKPPKNDLAWIYQEFHNDSVLNESVDIIAFGLDVNELDDGCSWSEMVRRMNTMIEFARSLGKMSYVIYINYPLNESCRINNKTDALGYGSPTDFLFWSLFRLDPSGNNQYKEWVGKGLMAISLPPLYILSGQQAFGSCENCSLIVNNQPNQPIFSYVLDFCQNYSLNGYTLPIVFSPTDSIYSLTVDSKDAYYFSNVSQLATVIRPTRYYTLSDKSKPLFMCTGCFLQLNESELNNYKRIFDLAEYEDACNDPNVDDLRIYGEILDVDLPFLRALIDSTSKFNKCYVSVVPESRQEEKCGYNLTWDELERYLEDSNVSCNLPSNLKYDYGKDSCENDASGEKCVPCGLGIMDVKNIKPGRAGNCGLYVPFDKNSNLCEGMYNLGIALNKAQKLLSTNIDVFFDVSEENALSASQNTEYTILWMLMASIYYDGEGSALEKAVEWYSKTRTWEEGEADCDLSGIPAQLCCSGNQYGICGPSIKFWDFLKGLGQVSENREVSEVYSRTKFGLIVMSKYFDAYDKCKDCTDPNWGREIDRRVCEVNPQFCGG